MRAPGAPRTSLLRFRNLRTEPFLPKGRLSQSFRPIRFPVATSSHSSFPSPPGRSPLPPHPDVRGPKSARPTNKRNRDIPGHRRRRVSFPARDRSPAACRPPRETREPGCPLRPPKFFYRARRSPSIAAAPRHSLFGLRLWKSRSPLSIRSGPCRPTTLSASAPRPSRDTSR